MAQGSCTMIASNSVASDEERQTALSSLRRKEAKPMKVFGRMTVFPIMPSRISRLYELAYNLWWSWHPEALALYSELDPDLWEDAGHNPVRFLSEVQPQRLEHAANNTAYLEH